MPWAVTSLTIDHSEPFNLQKFGGKSAADLSAQVSGYFHSLPGNRRLMHFKWRSGCQTRG